MKGALDVLRARAGEVLWGETPAERGWAGRAGAGLLRIVVVLARDLSSGRLTLRAMSLVYTTLLSFAPLLALSFSVLKAFGVHNQLEPLLLNIFAPLGEKAAEITGTIIGFVDNLRVGILGFIGLGLLLWTVISLLQKVEDAFNEIWRVTRRRSLTQRFRDYLSVLLVGPLLVVMALGITASFMSATVVQRIVAIEPFGTLFVLFGQLLPWLLAVAAFTFIYLFMPNTRVRLLPALVGAVVAGLLWQGLGWLFAALVVGSVRYHAVYSGFAWLILTLIWLHLGWLVLMLGASVAFYVQHPEHLRPATDEATGHRARERIALALMVRVTRAFVAGLPPPDTDELLHGLADDPVEVGNIITTLERAGLIAATGENDDRWLPAHDPATLSVKECLDAVRRPGADGGHEDDAADGVLDGIERAIADAAGGITLRELCGEPAPKNG